MGLLRLFLAVSVLAAHLRYGRGIFGFAFLPGGLGVQCFFIISGFYMALVLHEKYNYLGSYWAFIQQRFLRLYPLYLIVAVLILLVEGVITYAASQPVGVFAEWTKMAGTRTTFSVCYYVLVNVAILGLDTLRFFSQDNATGQLYFMTGEQPGFSHCVFYTLNGPTWTLSVEMTFYLLAPFLVRRSIAVQAAWLVASLGLRSWFYWTLPAKESLLWTYNFSPSVLFLFMAGSIGYQLYKRHGAAMEKFTGDYIWLFWLYGALMLLGPRLPLKEYYFWWYVPASMLVVPLLFAYTRTNKRDRFIGELSYPYYLIHYHVIIIAEFFLHENHNIIFGPLCAFVTFGISYLLYQGIEIRTERFREELFRKKRAATLGTAETLPAAITGNS